MPDLHPAKARKLQPSPRCGGADRQERHGQLAPPLLLGATAAMHATLDRLTRVTVVLLISSHRASAWSSPAVHGTAGPATRRPLATVKMGGGNVDDRGYQRGGGPLQYLPPNMGGQRVVKKQVTSNREARSSAGGDATSEIARRGFLGLAGLFSVAYFSVVSGGQEQTAATEETDPFGNAVTAPTLELDLDDLLELSRKQGVAPPDASVMALVQQLEETGGPQFEASFLQGKWVLPWVGGWERVWSSQADSLALTLTLTLTRTRALTRTPTLTRTPALTRNLTLTLTLALAPTVTLTLTLARPTRASSAALRAPRWAEAAGASCRSRAVATSSTGRARAASRSSTCTRRRASRPR